MRFVIFTHSLVSDWNHGNAHFLRGIATELAIRGHDVRIFEPSGGWSRQNMLAEAGDAAVQEFERVYPLIRSTLYSPESLDLAEALAGADVVIVHEWNDHALVQRIGEYRAARKSFRLYFHDTHHRSVTAPESMAAYQLQHYDGVLAYGAVIRDLYLERGWTARAWTWHEAADTRVFYPRQPGQIEGDLVWIGNWGDEERSQELREFLIAPVRQLGLRALVHGVRYPTAALAELADAGIEYGGWLPNHRVPDLFSRHRVTIHVPRRPYARALPGIPTIRPFEALACGIPLVSAPWQDTENLFRPGRDFLVAQTGAEMVSHLRSILNNPGLSQSLAASGLATIQSRHSCAHRVDQLLAIVAGKEALAAAEGSR